MRGVRAFRQRFLLLQQQGALGKAFLRHGFGGFHQIGGVAEAFLDRVNLGTGAGCRSLGLTDTLVQQADLIIKVLTPRLEQGALVLVECGNFRLLLAVDQLYRQSKPFRQAAFGQQTLFLDQQGVALVGQDVRAALVVVSSSKINGSPWRTTLPSAI